jgi:hypothetical protein
LSEAEVLRDGAQACVLFARRASQRRTGEESKRQFYPAADRDSRAQLVSPAN